MRTKTTVFASQAELAERGEQRTEQIAQARADSAEAEHVGHAGFWYITRRGVRLTLPHTSEAKAWDAYLRIRAIAQKTAQDSEKGDADARS